MRRLTILAASAILVASAPWVPASADGTEPLVTDGTPLCDSVEPTPVVEISVIAADGGSEPVPEPPMESPITDVEGIHRVASFNILHSQGPDKNLLHERIPLIADAMVDAGADVYGLQEVVGRFDVTTGESTDTAPYVAEQLAQRLADHTGETWSWCWFMANPHFPGEPDTQPGGGGGPATEAMIAFNPSNPGLRLGEAIITRYTVEEARSRRVTPRTYEAPLCDPVDAVSNPLGCPAESVFDSREIMWARLVDDHGESLDMFNTHVAHHLTDASQITKQIQVQVMLETIAQWDDPTTATYFTGDFNSVEDPSDRGEVTDRRGAVVDAGFADTWRVFADAVDLADSEGWTSDQDIVTDDPTPMADARIDYVFLRCPDGDALQVWGADRFADVPTLRGDGSWLWPSDHLAVQTTTRCAVETD